MRRGRKGELSDLYTEQIKYAKILNRVNRAEKTRSYISVAIAVTALVVIMARVFGSK